MTQTHPPADYVEGGDTRLLRDAMGCFGTGVTIITTLDAEGKPVGLTANSFTSLSLDPPLVLACVGNKAGSAPALRVCAGFTVNVLAEGQKDVSIRFAQRGVDRFALGDWSEGVTGGPVLGGALASFECAREDLHEGGDHFILIGRVRRARFSQEAAPLVYFRGAYRELTDKD